MAAILTGWSDGCENPTGNLDVTAIRGGLLLRKTPADLRAWRASTVSERR